MMNDNGVPTFRIVNTEDIVPDAPPSVIGTRLYRHIGTSVDFTAQYGSYDGNHSPVNAYEYALNHPTDPDGLLPAAILTVVLSASRVGRYAP
jgi:triacylglycerol lipase